MTDEIRLLPIRGLPEVRPGDDLAAIILGAVERAGLSFADGDVLVVAQKVVSKAEGQLVPLASVEPSALARSFAEEYDKDARQV